MYVVAGSLSHLWDNVPIIVVPDVLFMCSFTNLFLSPANFFPLFFLCQRLRK